MRNRQNNRNVVKRSARMIWKSVSRDGAGKGVAHGSRWPRIEKGFQAVCLSGPGYIEERARPVLAFIVKRRPRLFLVRGDWRDGRFNQYHVPRDTDFLEPHAESPIQYISLADAEIPWVDERERAETRFERLRQEEEANTVPAYEAILEANGTLNSVLYDFLGRATNDELFREDDFDSFRAAAARGEDLARLVDAIGPNQTVGLIDHMLGTLRYLRDVYAADRESVKAWRLERLEAHDALQEAAARDAAADRTLCSPRSTGVGTRFAESDRSITGVPTAVSAMTRPPRRIANRSDRAIARPGASL